MRGLVLVLFLLVAAWLAVPGAARAHEVVGVTTADGWLIYGAKTRFVRQAGPPGGGAAIVEATETVEAWSGGALAAFNSPVRAGESYTAVFWMRAAATAKVSALLLTNAPPYPTFARIEAVGEGAWKRVTITGVAKADAEAGRDALALHLGRAGGPVELGPAVILRGTPSTAELDALGRAYKPTRVVEDVTITAPDGVELAGTLRAPMGKGAYPVVVLLNGSGGHVRGEFKPLSERLLSAGIATLEYDKRGSGPSGGARTESVPVLAADAEAAVALLRGRADIDPARVVLVGHSQGGMIAPAVAARDPRLRGVVMQVAPALPSEQVVADQVTRQILVQWPQGGSYADQRAFIEMLIGVSLSERDAFARRSRLAALIEAAVAAGRIPRDAGDMLLGFFADGTMRDDILAYQPTPVLRKLRLPLLAVYGTEDPLVSAWQNAPAARAALKENRRAKVIELTGLNHYLQQAKTGAFEEWKTLGPPSPKALDYIVAWIEQTLAVARPPSPARRCSAATGCPPWRPGPSLPRRRGRRAGSRWG